MQIGSNNNDQPKNLKPRILSVRPFHRQDTRERIFKPTPTYPTTVPEIRLCGNWLEKLGFTHGKKVMVVLGEGTLTIQLTDQ